MKVSDLATPKRDYCSLSSTPPVHACCLSGLEDRLQLLNSIDKQVASLR